MTAIITGTDLGLTNNPLTPNGRPDVGGSGQSDQVYVNSTTGNLVIQARDEYVAALGPDLSLIRTYNSLGQFTDDNADNWRLGVHERVYGLTGTVNTAGSTVKKTYGDGAEITFAFDTARNLYFTAAGDSADDTLEFNSSTHEWTWTDGTTRFTDTFDSAGLLIESRDTDGNVRTYGYNGGHVTHIFDASGQATHFDYVGNNLAQILVVSGGLTQTLVRYTYDAANRLTQVNVDLSPEDNSIADGRTYTTTYTYDGTSKRIASITQGDGTTVSFTYTKVGEEWRVATITDASGAVTRMSYSTQTVAAAAQADINKLTAFQPLPPVDYALNLSAASTTDTTTQFTTFTLDTSHLTVTPADWTAVSTAATGNVAAPQMAVGANGQRFAIWKQTDSATGQSTLYASHRLKSSVQRRLPGISNTRTKVTHELYAWRRTAHF